MNETEKQTLLEARAWVREELALCVRFWLEHGMDAEYGGVMTCLDRAGNVFSTDKSVWMQGRCGWLFARLCGAYGANDEWLAASKSCVDFLERHCVNRAAGGRLFFTVTRDGRPLRQRRYCFSEGFYVMANAEYALASGDAEALSRARGAYDLVWRLQRGELADPVGLPPKTFPETRATRALADPMIYLNLCAVMTRCDPENAALYGARADECARDIFRFHHKPEMACTLETVGMDGAFLADTTAGRVVNPGHDIECSWFLMEHANRAGDAALHQRAVDMFRFAAEAGWDAEYGGLLYFVDCLGKPPEAYEHDMKLWWPHTEMLIASMMAYRDTRDEACLGWFNRTLDYCKRYFSDPEYGEWYGYLRRDGKPTQPPCKGSTFKGPFHLPRMLLMVDGLLSEVLAGADA